MRQPIARASRLACNGLLAPVWYQHLDKLKRDEPKAAAAIEGRIMEITTQIGADLPKTLPMREQDRFALGYYNRKAHNRAAAREAWEKKQNNNHEKEAV